MFGEEMRLSLIIPIVRLMCYEIVFFFLSDSHAADTSARSSTEFIVSSPIQFSRVRIESVHGKGVSLRR